MKYLIVLIIILNKSFAQTINSHYDISARLTEMDFQNSSNAKWQYDNNGNRISQRISSVHCPLNYLTYYADSTNPTIKSYQWQVKSGNSFVDLNEGPNYQGTTSPTLQLINVPTNWYGNVYRCRITFTDNSFIYNPTNKLVFALHWTGAANKDWHNPLNWDCNAIPDENTDVYINTGSSLYPEVNAPAFCRSLSTQAGTAVNVKDGVLLKVSGNSKQYSF